MSTFSPRIRKPCLDNRWQCKALWGASRLRRQLPWRSARRSDDCSEERLPALRQRGLLKLVTRTSTVACGLLGFLAEPLVAQDTVEFLQEQQTDVHFPPATPWWEFEAGTGDWFGARTFLQERGIEWFGGYSYTVQSALPYTGPASGEWIYSGMLDFGLHLDLERLVGWTGGSFQTTWLWSRATRLRNQFRTISSSAPIWPASGPFGCLSFGFSRTFLRT